jgi:hypothetical protein
MEEKMKARLQPIYFKGEKTPGFDTQLETLRMLLTEEAVLLDPLELGAVLPTSDAVIFPVLLGAAFSQAAEIRKIKEPLIVLTSEFGTVAMWDWEIVTFLKAEGMKIFAPYDISLTKVICRALGVKQELKKTKFLVFQDKPGVGGMQPEIFKRFYWWEDSCTALLEEKFGIRIVKKSFEKLGLDAKNISDEAADVVLDRWVMNKEGLSEKPLRSAAKMYLAIKEAIAAEDGVGGVGINCLNESSFSDTTPCLAYNMLFQEEGILWICEGDTMSLMTKFIAYKSLKAPIMMSNLYPFLMGMAALKHEKITKFPDIAEPDNCILVAHCGYFGLMPQCFSCEWTLRPPALAIVDENAHAIDAQLPTGPVTLVKLHSSMDRLQVIEGNMEEYVQYPGSDCRNGGIIRVKDGRRMMDLLYSHHSCIVVGHKSTELELVAKVFDLVPEGSR